MCDEVFSLALFSFGTALLHSEPMELDTVFIIMWLVGLYVALRSLHAAVSPTTMVDDQLLPSALADLLAGLHQMF